jgi:tRNA(Ile)-lysidine synthase
MELLDRVRQSIRRHDLARADTRVVVALSGGSDSVALAHLVRALDLVRELRLAGLAHFNHQLRPAASDDERFCVELAVALAQPLLVDHGDVREIARRERRSLEDAARSARHRFLSRARQHFQADVVALGHTRDDQAETFLLRLLRGAGARGLAAMHPRRGSLIRPLLDCRRAALRAYLASQRLGYCHDESNEDLSIPRNRVRAELMPFLERFNPSIVDVLADEADLAREEWRWMAAAEDELWPRVCQRTGNEWRLRIDLLRTAPVALARLVIRRALVDAAGGRAVSFAHVEAALGLVREGGSPVDLPGQRTQRNGADLVLRARPRGAAGRSPALSGSPSNSFQYPLPIPGEACLVEAACIVSAEVSASPGDTPRRAGAGKGPVAVLRLDRCRGPLSVRNRRPGDRFSPPGLGGHRTKLQDYFVNRKVPRERRDAVPLVVDETDRIVWVAGHAIDEDFRVTDPTQAVLILRLKLLGGPA